MKKIMEQEELRKLYSCRDCSLNGPKQSWPDLPRDLLFMSSWSVTSLYPSFFSEDTGVHRYLTEKNEPNQKHNKELKPPENPPKNPWIQLVRLLSWFF